ncbi:ABC transporter substrate-binding protein [Micromonospora peucetia]|uniref:ABC transporter substrate-binding protein n=1 Tax=Micromonospora peucetia TaxID=47871 RepID=A0A1C6UKF2_9ACTN|nr:ABC transporter substrate-binding protein [Micromonospora peucetia]WSA34220.1 ABC transporter substrate-binding protein [Micromonospora peucetia]SCL54424.1 iron complex transport system substrate-binding protein [Micromonospora peucetia]
MSVRQHRRLTVAAALALAVLTGCGSDGAESAATSGGGSDTRVFAADNGEISIPVDPKRVVATGYAVPVLIEADAALVGISTWKRGLAMMTEQDRATYDRLSKVAGEAAAETNYEAIAAAKPDLIVIGVPKPVLGDIDMKRLESIAPVVAIGPTVPDAWRELSRRQSDAAGRTEHFQAAKDAYEKKAGELKARYGTALASLKFGHVGSYGDISKGTFQREFAKAWGTNIAQDAGVTYYGEVKEKGGGGRDVSEYPALEELPESLGEADAITYTVQPDGTPAEAVKQVLDSALWKNLPAVKAGRVFPLRYTEAATYESALKTLDSIDKAFAPLLTR